jgi:hypothetical protein
MSEASAQAEPVRSEGHPAGSPVSGCYHCGADLPSPSARVCEQCGRRQTRTCFCGATIARGPVVCSECGTDWTKVRRRSRRSAGGRKRNLLVHSLAGGAVALGTAAILYLVYFLSVHVVDSAPQAMSSMASGLSGVWQAIADRALPICAAVAVFAVGALGGVARYHIRQSRRAASRRRPERER